MAQLNQLGVAAIAGGDITVKNYGGSDIAAGLAVKYDTSNPGDATNPRGVVLTSSDVTPIGITVTTIPAGKTGVVRVLGQAVGTASGTVHVGDFLMTDSAGKVLLKAGATYQIGYACSEAVASDLVVVQIFPAKNQN